MKTPLFVRPLTDAEQQAVEAGLRSSKAFVLRRCQIIRTSAQGKRAPVIATLVGFSDQGVRDVIVAFNQTGLAALQARSSRPHTSHAAFSAEGLEQLVALLHRNPREFSHPQSLWTLDLIAEVSFAEGLTEAVVTGETIRQALKRLGKNWKRAKHWITSPDPAYAKKKRSAIGCCSSPVSSPAGQSGFSMKSGGAASPSPR